jgi:hypothetical protein
MNTFRFGIVAAIILAGVQHGQGAATLHIGFGAGTACAQGCGGDPNLSGSASSSVDIFQNSGGAATITNPMLILAVPNGNTVPSIASETDYNPYTGAATGGTVGSASLLSTTAPFTSSSTGDVYSALGLVQQGTGTNSDSYVNLQAAETANGITATSFTLYEIGITSNLGAKGLANVTFGSSLPVGTFAFGYGVSDQTYSTPFTEAGLITRGKTPPSVPEPTSMLMLGGGLSVIGLLMRKRYCNN